MLIAKEGKSFTDAGFVMAGNICPDIVHKYEEVPLPARTITRRIEDVGDNFLNQLIKKTKTFQYFSLAFDESTDIVGSAQLIVFIQGINEKFEITEEIPAVCILKRTTRGEDNFLHVQNIIISSLDLQLHKLVSVTTNGARNMTGKNIGFQAN
ncbi:PREDICTED: general transcription factor II-I repeat domain-containing protein 2-like [Diuraphis noxia]|uniref:general transcription factor II-I repeat domain-containing protein 2-like n=1 Tax=Diuraphis noxia TaxID=143948 RepID=UPI0007639757|nr:PREDICTED: general transcription factor II-I repeat domain-containing protein 2-like [Diuraphis noxia]